MDKRLSAKIPKKSMSGHFYICPNCQKFISRNEHAHGNLDIRFCKWCGQAFSWKRVN